jgi:hypothetical protein
MSAELPQLEQLIADAAERHYGSRRRWRLPSPRLSLVAGVVAAAAAVVLAIAIFPLGSDERSAAGSRTHPTTEVAQRYGIFARGQDPGPRAFETAEDQLRSLDPKQPVAVRTLRRFDDGAIVVVAGTSPAGEPALCFAEERAQSGGGGCSNVADLPRNEPWFPYGVPGVDDNTITAVVPDSVESVRIVLRNGTTRNVPIENNLAYETADQTICAVGWTTEDNRTDHERSLFWGDEPRRC